MATDQPSWRFGSAPVEQAAQNGWIVGHFIDPDDLSHSTDVEVKWGIHRAGEQHNPWQHAEHRTTIVVLVAGRFHITLDAASHTLEHPGDYATWSQGIGHSWHAEEDSIVITVRWPSLPHSPSTAP